LRYAPIASIFPRRSELMRQWLDQNGRPLVRFETEADGDTVRFDADELAERFRQSFGGSFEGVPPPINTEAAKLGANHWD
jgi:hypothetical protein